MFFFLKFIGLFGLFHSSIFAFILFFFESFFMLFVALLVRKIRVEILI